MFYSYFLLWPLIIGTLLALILHLALANTTLLIKNGLGMFVIFGTFIILRLFTPLDLCPQSHSLEYPAFLSSLLRPNRLFFGKFHLSEILFFISVLVSLVIFLHFIRSVKAAKCTLYDHSCPHEDGLAMIFKIDPDCPIPVRQTFLVSFPVIVGYFHPIIYLPVQDFSKEDLCNVITHEYTHWKFHHLHIKLFVHMSTILLWWNPLIYLLEKDLSHIIELVCDDIVMNQFNDQEKLDYLDTLIRCMRQQKKDHKVSSVYAMGFLTRSKGHDTIQRFEYQINRQLPALPFYLRQAGIYLFLFLLIGSTYFFTIQPAYNPYHAENQSSSENAILMECEDGSYYIEFRGNQIPVDAKSVRQERFPIYKVIPYEK